MNLEIKLHSLFSIYMLNWSIYWEKIIAIFIYDISNFIISRIYQIGLFLEIYFYSLQLALVELSYIKSQHQWCNG